MTPAPPPSPTAELWGGALLGVVESLAAVGITQDRVETLLTKVGIRWPDPVGWYPLTAYLGFLAAVEAHHGAEALHALGRAIPERAKFAPDLDGMERALQVLDVAYQVNHRGPILGGYHPRLVAPGQAELVCDNPYPCAMDLGLLERLLERAAGGSPRASVVHRPGPACRRLGARACVFDLRW
ncbi:MAG: hypothetical protein ACOYNX_03610 [Geothrix sp.]